MNMLKKVAQFLVAPAMIVGGVMVANAWGAGDKEPKPAPVKAVEAEPEVVLDPKGVNPLPVKVARNRVTAKHLAIVCPRITDLERGLNLHNARRVDTALGLGCRYLRPGEQGVRIQTLGNMQELLFDTAKGEVSYWGYISHFTWEV
jgi:hypothetical protein